jgi:hypothetical protein
MSRTRVLTPEVIAGIHRRRAQGLTLQQLVAEFGVSMGSVQTAIKTPPPLLPGPHKPATSSPEADDSEDEDPPDVEGKGPTGEALQAIAWKTAQRLDRMGDKAADPAVYRGLAKDLISAIKELSRLMPPTPADPESMPDMVAAAERAREKILRRIQTTLTLRDQRAEKP